MNTTEDYLRTALEAATEADECNEWFDAELDMWLIDVRRFLQAALARARELRLIELLEGDPAA